MSELMVVADALELEALCKYHKQQAKDWRETVEAMVRCTDKAFGVLDEMFDDGLIDEDVYEILQDAVMDIKSPRYLED